MNHYEPSEREINHFILLLRGSVEYDKIKKVHFLGISILTNYDLHKMCSHNFKKDYDLMTYAEQRKLREKIFRALRGGSNGKKH